jgi:hypothetical protein
MVRFRARERTSCTRQGRGIPLATDADYRFIVPADARLTAADRAAIARWFHHLGAILEYRAPELS